MSRAGWVGALAMLVCVAGAMRMACAAEPMVTQVLIEGNVRVEDDAIRVNLESRAGQPLDPARIDRDVRAIYGMGFFEQVNVEQREETGGVVLVFKVEERPLVR